MFKVTHLIQGLQVGGLEIMVCNLLKGMDRRRFEPGICCFDMLGPLTGALQDEGIPVDLVPRKPGRDYTYPWRLARFLRKKKTHVLHLHNPTALFYGTLAGKLAGVPVIIYTEHGRDHSSSMKIRVADKIMSELVDKVVVVAEHGRQRLVEQEWMREKKIAKIFNGIDGERFSGTVDRKNAREQLGITGEIPVISIVARLDPIKNHRVLFKAMETVRRQLPEVRLLVAGDGPLRQDLEQQVLAAGLERNIIFLGDRNDIHRLLAASDLFVLPSLSEGLSMTLLEACASARPIVATDVGGNAEVVEHGRNGLLVPSDNAGRLAESMVALLRDSNKSEAMGRAGRQKFVEEFSLEKMVGDYQDLYLSHLQAEGFAD